MKGAAVSTAAIAIFGQAALAQVPRMAPPPPCRAAAPDVQPLLTLWGSDQPRGRSRVAVFNLQSEIDDPARIHYPSSLARRIRERLSEAPGLVLASEGSVARAMSAAQGRRDSAAVLLDADYSVTGQVRVAASRQEVTVTLIRSGQAEPVWQASFRATPSLRAIEDAVVRGLWRALSIPAAPTTPAGWPANDAAYEAVVAGTAFLRSTTRAGADSAVASYERAVSLAPESPVAVIKLARALVTAMERGSDASAGGVMVSNRVGSLVNEALAADSLLGEGWTVRAMLARVLDPVRFEGALEAHRRARALAPAAADAEHAFGVTLMRLGDARGAAQHFRRALQLEPGRAATLAALGEMEMRAERWAAACEFTNASIIAWPFDPLPYAVRAQSRLRLADARDAYSDAELVRRLTTGAWAAALRVLIARGAGNVDMARQLVTELTASWLVPSSTLDVRDAEYMALAYLVTGDERRALESLRRATPVGADLAVALLSPGLVAIRSDTTVKRLLSEVSAGRPRRSR